MNGTSTPMNQPGVGNVSNRLKPNYTYEAALSASERVNWRISDIIGGDKHLDFTRPFMPESLARTEPLSFLSRRERS
jgi:hypothetical protein